MATSLPFLNSTGIWLLSSRQTRRRSQIVSRKDLPEFSAKAVISSQRLRLWPSRSDERFLSSGYLTDVSSSMRSVSVRSQLSTPLISSNDEWGTWTALFATGAFGIWFASIFFRSNE